MDGETSGLRIDRGAKLIQAVLALATADGYDVFASLLNPGPLTWCSRAERVHRIPRHRIEQAPDAATVDRAAADWLRSRIGAAPRRTVIAVGFNVALFDFPFFHAALPATMSLLAPNIIDLNDATEVVQVAPRHADGRDGRGSLKSRARREAAADLAATGVAGGPHDAGWDAAEALAYLANLRRRLPAGPAGGVPDDLAAYLNGHGADVAAAAGSAFPDTATAAQWFETPQPALDFASPEDLLVAGRVDAVLAALRNYRVTVEALTQVAAHTPAAHSQHP